jgi:hypothetical protein
MKVTLEGVPPFPLPRVQSATAQFSGETVEMTLFLLDDHQQMASVSVPMSIATAQTLALALSRAALEADRANGRG